MGHCDTAGLLGVIVEVSLSVHVSVVADDLDGVLVGTDSTVCAETPELAVDCAGRCSHESRACRQGQIGDIVYDAEREALLVKVLKYSLDLCRVCILGTEAVTAGVDDNVLELGIEQCSDDIEVKRFAVSARLFCSVEDVDDLDSLRDSVDESFVGERTIQSDFDDTDLCSLFLTEVIDCLINCLADRAHSDDNGFSFRIAIVIEQAVVCADLGVYFVHVHLDDFRHLVISRVASFASLEEDIRVLSGASLARMIRIKGMITELLDCFMVYHLVEISVIPCTDLLDLVGCTETIEEVDERKAALDCCHMSNRCKIHNFLYGRLAQHTCAGLTTCIYVRVIAEDGKCMGSKRTSGYVENARELLAGNFVDVRDHKKKTLRSGVSCCHSACCKGAVEST